MEGSAAPGNITARFTAEQKIERTDESKEKDVKYAVTVEITPDSKITKFNLRKIQ